LPRIERYTRGIVRRRDVPNTVNPSAITDAAAPYNTAANISQFGANKLQEIVVAREKTAVNEASIKSKRLKMERMAEWRKENQETPDDFAKRMEPELKKIDEQLAKSLPTSRSKKAFLEEAASTNFSAYKDNFEWEQTRHVANAANDIESSVRETGNAAYSIAAQEDISMEEKLRQFSEARKDIDKTIEAASSVVGRGNKQIQQVESSSRQTMERSFAMGLMESNPEEAIEFLDNVERSGAITPGDRANLVNMAQNLKKAREKEAKKRAVVDEAQVLKNETAIRERVNSGDYASAPEMVAQIRRMHMNGKISSGVATDAIQVINADKKVNAPTSKTELEKANFYNNITSRLIQFEEGTKTDKEGKVKGVTPEKLAEFRSIEEKVAEGVQAGFLTASQSRNLLNPKRELLEKFIASEGKEAGFFETANPFYSPDPVTYAARKINMEPMGNVSRGRLMTEYGGLLGRVKADGTVLDKANDTIDTSDPSVMEATLDAARDRLNRRMNTEAFNAGANDVVPMTEDEIEKEIRQLEKELGLG